MEQPAFHIISGEVSSNHICDDIITVVNASAKVIGKEAPAVGSLSGNLNYKLVSQLNCCGGCHLHPDQIFVADNGNKGKN